MTKIRDQKGAITMITLITVLFLVSFLMSTYIIISNKVKTQKEMLNETKSIYEPKVTMEEIYNSYFSNDAVIPIYTVNQLLAIGNGEKINIDGKIYTFTSNKVYILKNNLEFSVKDLGLETDWIPIYNSENIEWNGHTIKVTTLNENVITYSENTIIGYPITLADTKESVLADYRIYGNSIQNGTPNPETPIEVESVGDLVTDENDINYGKYRIPVKVSGDNGNEQTFNIILDEPLRKIGDYADYIDFEKKQVIRKIHVLDDITEDMSYQSIYRISENVVRFGVYKASAPTAKSGVSTVLSDFLPAYENSISGIWLSDSEYIFIHPNSGKNYYFSFSKERLGVTDTDTEEQILQKGFDYLNAITKRKVYYALETPLDPQTIDLPEIQLYKGINTITVDTDVQPSNMSITYNVKQ